MEIVQKQTRDAMENTFEGLMRLPEGSQVWWLGIVSDLVELVHMMWYDGPTTNEHGQVLNFSTTVDLPCEWLDLPLPRKSNMVMNNVRKRRNPDLLLPTRCRHPMERGEEPPGRFIKEETSPPAPPQRRGKQLASDFELYLL